MQRDEESVSMFNQAPRDGEVESEEEEGDGDGDLVWR